MGHTVDGQGLEYLGCMTLAPTTKSRGGSKGVYCVPRIPKITWKKNKIGKNILDLRNKHKYVSPLNCELENSHLFMISGYDFYTNIMKFIFFIGNNLSKYINEVIGKSDWKNNHSF